MTVEQRYKKREPCENCPFRTDVTPYLRRDRAEEISDALREGGEFSCHKTVDYDGDGEDDEGNITGRETKQEQFCAGALIMLEKSSGPNQMMRVAQRLGMYDPSKLNMEAPVFDTPLNFILAQEREGDDPEMPEGGWETCHVVGSNCAMPAGFMTGGGAKVNVNTEGELPYCYRCGEATCYECSSDFSDKVPFHEEGARICEDCLEDEEDE